MDIIPIVPHRAWPAPPPPASPGSCLRACPSSDHTGELFQTPAHTQQSFEGQGIGGSGGAGADTRRGPACRLSQWCRVCVVWVSVLVCGEGAHTLWRWSGPVPHCFRSYTMWEVWTWLPQPSGGHERSVCKCESPCPQKGIPRAHRGGRAETPASGTPRATCQPSLPCPPH